MQTYFTSLNVDKSSYYHPHHHDHDHPPQKKIKSNVKICIDDKPGLYYDMPDMYDEITHISGHTCLVLRSMG